MTNIRKKKSKFDIFQRANVGTALAVVSFILSIIWPHQADLFAALLAIYVGIFLSARPRDEFELACWHAGCAATFRALLIALIVIPFFGGIFDGFTDAHMGTPPHSTVVEKSLYHTQIKMIMETAPYVAFIAFFFGFQRKRIKGI